MEICPIAGSVPGETQHVIARPRLLDELQHQVVMLHAAVLRTQVMLSFATDPYPPAPNVNITRRCLEILRDNGFGFCTLTKAGGRSAVDIDLFRPAHDAYAMTLTSVDDDYVRKWKPHAAPPSDRMATLRRFHESGIFTWLSLEPVSSAEESVRVINATAPFVDLFKLAG